MSKFDLQRKHDERGATLMLVIAFMVLMGTISAAVLSTTTSGIQQRVALDQARNRQYAADAGIESMIATARGSSGTCPAPTNFTFPAANQFPPIHVDCSIRPTTIVGTDGIPKLQDDLAFAACLGTVACAPSTPIINAQVNFQGTAPTVKTYVQAWSVNG